MLFNGNLVSFFFISRRQLPKLWRLQLEHRLQRYSTTAIRHNKSYSAASMNLITTKIAVGPKIKVNSRYFYASVNLLEQHQQRGQQILSPPGSSQYDQIGPADPESNLRRVKFRVPDRETPLERKLRNLREETLSWSHRFWAEHNRDFGEEREKFKNESESGERKMSQFYREFLDKNWKKHLNYNLEWQKRNFSILGLSLAVLAQNIFVRRK